MSASSKIRERIRRLREMTAARGCTEQEAMAAAEKAARLMRDHGISERDLVMDEQASRARQKGQGQKARLWPVIAYCTNTSSIVVQGLDGNAVHFVGREPGPEIAVYLREICERAIDRELAAFKAGKLYRRKRSKAVRRQVAAAFVGGMVARLNRRLIDIFGPTRSAEAREEAERVLAERYPDMVDLPEAKRELRHHEASWSGYQAGDRVTLAHGVGGDAAPLQIGGGS